MILLLTIIVAFVMIVCSLMIIPIIYEAWHDMIVAIKQRRKENPRQY